MEQNSAKSFSAKKRLKYNTYLVVSLAIVMALVVALNAVAALLEERFHLVLDFTSDSRFSISDESKTYVNSVDIPVKIYMLNSRTNWEGSSSAAQVLSMVQNYAALNDKIEIEFVDLDKNPSFKNKFPKAELVAYDVIFETQYRHFKVSQSDLASYFDYEYYVYNQGAISYTSNAENLLTGALVSVSSKTQPIAYFLTGNGQSEEDNSSFINLLNLNGYSVETVNLLTGEIPTTNEAGESVDFLILAQPTMDFTDTQLQKIDAFLRNGGEYGKNLIYFGAYTSPDLPGLYAYLEEWGIKVQEGVTLETSEGYVDTSSGICVLTYETAEDDEKVKNFTKDFANKMQYVGSWPAQKLSLVFERKEFITTHTLLSFQKGLWYDYTEDKKTVESAEQPKDMPAVVLSEKVFIDTDGYEKPASNVLVFASNVQEDNLLSITTMVNDQYIINAFNTLIHKEETVHVSSKTVSKNEITMTAAERNGLLITFVAVIPLTMLGVGVFIWQRRRRL